MHKPPAVRVVVNRSRLHLCVVLVLWFLGWVVLFTFLQSQAVVEFERMLVPVWGASLMLLGVVAVLGWLRIRQGFLRWDGQRWHWVELDTAYACEVLLRLDFQKVVLVRVSVDNGATLWLWLSVSSAGDQWLPLRRALVASKPVGSSSL